MQGNKNFIRYISTLIGVVLLLVSIFLVKGFVMDPAEKEFSEKAIRIGLIAPLTGSSKAGGEEMKKGVELAVKNINANGGIDGRKLILVIYDDKGNPSEAEKAAKSLIFLDNIEAIIGPFNSDCCLAIMGLVNNLKTPLITPVAMADEINIKDDYIFRNTLGASSAQRKINGFVSGQNQYILLEGFGAKTIGIIWQDDAWGYEMQELVKSDLTALGREDTIILNESFSIGSNNFPELFGKYKENYPDLIYVVSSGEEAITIVKSGRDQGYTGLFYGEGGFNSNDFDRELREYANGCLFSSQWHPYFSTPMSDVFVTSYMRNYDGAPNMFTAISYEAVYILKESLNNVVGFIEWDNFKEILRDKLASTTKISGITGDLYMNEYGQCNRPMFILQKRWTGRNIQSAIIYPRRYNQSQILWDFNL